MSERQPVSNQGHVSHQFYGLLPREIERFDSLADVGEVKVKSSEQYLFEVQVFFSDLDPRAVRVELYADGGTSVRQEMGRLHQIDGAQGVNVYCAAVSATRPSAHFTVRVIPHCDGVAIPLEDARILWQR